MKSVQLNTESTCSVERCNRRSFIFKTFCSSLGFSATSGLFLSAIASSTSTNKTREDIYAELDELVDKYFPVYHTCSQTSFMALNDVFNLKAQEVVKAMAPFPGIGMRGETCGAVSGCLAAIGVVFEKESTEATASQRRSREPAYSFCSKFENEYGSTRCRDVIAHITGKQYELSKPQDYQILSQEGVYQHCPEIVKNATHMAADIILDKI